MGGIGCSDDGEDERLKGELEGFLGFSMMRRESIHVGGLCSSRDIEISQAPGSTVLLPLHVLVSFTRNERRHIRPMIYFVRLCNIEKRKDVTSGDILDTDFF